MDFTLNKDIPLILQTIYGLFVYFYNDDHVIDQGRL